MNNQKEQKANEKKEKAIISSINKRLVESCKVIAVKLHKIDDIDIELSAIKTQAKAIDYCIRARLNFNQIVDKLVSSKLCINNQSAIARLKRHYKHDIDTRIIKRNVISVSHNKLDADI